MSYIPIWTLIRKSHHYIRAITYNTETYVFNNVRWLTYSNCRDIDVMGDISGLMDRYFEP